MNQQLTQNFISILFNTIYALLFIRVLLSWVPSLQRNSIAVFVHDVTEPILAPIRKVLPQGMGIDFSPIVAFIGLQIIESLIYRYI